MAMALNLLSPSTHHRLPFSSEKPRKSSPIPLPNHGALCFSLSPKSASSRSCCARDGRLLAQAVKEEQAQPVGLDEAQMPKSPQSSSKLVLVVGGTGGVGQLIVASLLSRKIKSRLLLRDPSKAVSLFGEQGDNILEVRKGDTRNPNDLDPAIFEGCCFIGSHARDLLHWNHSIPLKALGGRQYP